MVEKKNSKVGGPTAAGEGGGEAPRSRRRWRLAAVVGAVLALLLATAVSSGSFPRLWIWRNSCKCPMGELFLSRDARKYSGVVEDCCCDYETVNQLNEEVLHPILQEIVKTPFFRYFKVKLWCDCPFWPDDGMCRLRDCSVCECPDNEFPEPFKRPSRARSADDMVCQEGKPQAAVDRTLDSNAFTGWIEVDNPWTYDDETDNG